MSRFQAKTNTILEKELEFLREEMGLRQNQKADLLRELAVLAGWIVRQAGQDRVIQAQGEDGVQVLEHPVLARLQQEQRQLGEPLQLSQTEVEKLAEIMGREFRPSAKLRDSLLRIAAPDRQPPPIEWREAKK